MAPWGCPCSQKSGGAQRGGNVLGVSHKKLSSWYLQLAQQLAAGTTLTEALANASGVPSRDSLEMIEELSRGVSLPETLERAPGWWPRDDRVILAAAARSGRMVPSLYLLSQKHKDLARHSAHAMGAAVYPLFVLHFAVLILPLPELIMGSAEVYARQVISVLLPLWLLIGLFVVAARKRSACLGFALGFVPGLRGYRRARALADFCFTLEGLISAGESYSGAWEQAGSSAEHRVIRRCAARVAEVAKQGRAPGEALQRERALPGNFISLYTVGEKSGRLEENLRELANHFQEEAQGKLAAASFWYPKLLFIVIAAWLAVKILSFYTGLYEQMDPLLF